MNKGNLKKGGSFILKAVIFVGIVAIIAVSLAIFKETKKKKEIQNEINELQRQAEKIRRENAVLSDKIAYFNSRDYQEKEAKDKLNLQSYGEKVVVLEKEANENREKTIEEKESVQEIIIQTSNVRNWWDYFFKY